MKSVMTKDFELRGISHCRLLRLSLFARVIPIGNLGGGAGLRCLVAIAIRHYFGNIFYVVKARDHRIFNRFKMLLRMYRKT
jgi:hypothetical protein